MDSCLYTNSKLRQPVNTTVVKYRFAKCHQTAIPSYILTFEKVPLANAIQKRNNRFLCTFYKLFIRLQPYSNIISDYKFHGRTCKRPLHVRPYPLGTYVHTPLGRTSTNLWTYVQRKNHLSKREFCPKIVIFCARENRIFARKGILG